MQTFTKDILNNIIKNNQITETQAIVVINNIRAIIKNYVQKNNLQSLVIGVSGGLDSACVAALCQKEYTGVDLIGISIPLNNTNEHMEQAQWVGDNFCTKFREFREWEVIAENNKPLYENIFEVLSKTDDIMVKENLPTKILQGNMKARLRMITLYDLARKNNGMVLSTDNYSELLMGFWTICGDVGDYGPIQQIWKGLELPTIAKALGVREDIITQKPSDGLMVTNDNTDEAQLGAAYPYVDAIMMTYFAKNNNWDMIKDDKIVKGIVQRYENTHFKRNGCINLTREEIGMD